MVAANEAIIIGAGIGGLTAAVALNRIGIRTRVLEQAEQPRESGAGLTLWSNAVAALAQLDLHDAIAQAGSVVESVDVLTAPGRMLGGISLSALNLPFASISIHRRALLEVVATAARSSGLCEIEGGRQCVGLKQDPSKATAIFADGREESADLIIGADGIGSRTRSVVIPQPDPAIYAGYTCYRGVAELHPPGWLPHRLTETVGKGAQFGVLDLGHGRVGWYATINTDPRERQNKPGYYIKQDLLKRFGKWHEPISAVIDSTPSNEVLTNDIYDREPTTKTFCNGRICLLGDAAHPTTPNLGQGACLAIEDAIELASCLSENHAIRDAFAAYDRRRVKRTAKAVLQSRLAGQLCQLESPFGCMFRNYLMKFSLSGRLPPGWDWLIEKYQPPTLNAVVG